MKFPSLPHYSKEELLRPKNNDEMNCPNFEDVIEVVGVDGWFSTNNVVQ